ncbi:uncharacterized protein DUF1446 [Neobacillus bataviensis]|uniref:Uncharacterized protein DUF1446 n=1 Tax=Neobacillus bataviensis TaxID=220685 RepID=A0A561E0M5_9BACI|nr:acyclic terpene utilization AtuA family protein [Neobacillus bataviensis]TWE09140.1 uncharacterized protein DUF1446 [Neobacillus bataviensis]
MKKIRIGSGAGYAGDRIEPVIDFIKKGNLDYIIFECLAERTGNQAAQDCSSSWDDVYHNVEKYLDYTVIETGEKL